MPVLTEPARYIIWGAAGHAKVIAECIVRTGGSVMALFDNAPLQHSPLPDVPLHVGREGFSRWRTATPGTLPVCGTIAIGGSKGRDRLEVLELFRANAILTPALIHPDATIHAGVEIGEGSQVLAQSLLASGTRIGRACIINHRAGVDHECTLGDGVHIAPGATLCGCVHLADNVFVGAGATILPRIHVGENAIIGAGAVVTRDVPENATVLGNPARMRP